MNTDEALGEALENEEFAQDFEELCQKLEKLNN